MNFCIRAGRCHCILRAFEDCHLGTTSIILPLISPAFEDNQANLSTLSYANMRSGVSDHTLYLL